MAWYLTVKIVRKGAQTVADPYVCVWGGGGQSWDEQDIAGMTEEDQQDQVIREAAMEEGGGSLTGTDHVGSTACGQGSRWEVFDLHQIQVKEVGAGNIILDLCRKVSVYSDKNSVELKVCL